MYCSTVGMSANQIASGHGLLRFRRRMEMRWLLGLRWNEEKREEWHYRRVGGRSRTIRPITFGGGVTSNAFFAGVWGMTCEIDPTKRSHPGFHRSAQARKMIKFDSPSRVPRVARLGAVSQWQRKLRMVEPLLLPFWLK